MLEHQYTTCISVHSSDYNFFNFLLYTFGYFLTEGLKNDNNNNNSFIGSDEGEVSPINWKWNCRILVLGLRLFRSRTSSSAYRYLQRGSGGFE